MFDQIDRTLKNARGHYRERILAISAYERGYPVTEIAKLYGKTRKTIYNWIHRYESSGIEALRDRPKPGRPLLIEDTYSKNTLMFVGNFAGTKQGSKLHKSVR